MVGFHQGIDAEVRDRVLAMVFSSRTGGAGHVVSIRVAEQGDRVVSCTCPAMVGLETKPRGCWAMSAVRAMVGIPEPY